MKGLNKVTLIGHVGDFPEYKELKNGTKLANLSLATNRIWKNKETNELVEETEWHRLTAFGKSAETLTKHVKKGAQLYIEGRLKTEKFDKEGQVHYSTKIIVEKFGFLDKFTEDNQEV